MSEEKMNTSVADALQSLLWPNIAIGNKVIIKAAIERIRELEELCGEAYQVVGVLAERTGHFDDPQVQKELDNLADARMIHKDVLPFNVSTQKQEKYCVR